MRTSAFILGGLAGVLCLVTASLAFIFLLVPGEADDPSKRLLTMGYMGVALALVGFLGAGLAPGRPRLASVVLLAAAVVSPFYVGPLWLLIPPLYLIAALLAFLGREKRPRQQRAVSRVEHDPAVR